MITLHTGSQVLLVEGWGMTYKQAGLKVSPRNEYLCRCMACLLRRQWSCSGGTVSLLGALNTEDVAAVL